MLKSETNTNKTVFEQQAEQLLNELSSIINEKWPSLNNTGCNHIKSLINLYTDISNKESSSIYDSNLNSWTFNSNTLDFIRQCNEKFEKLNETLNNFSIYLNRLIKINANLVSLSESNLEIFRLISYSSLKNDLADLCQCFQKEFTLKTVLIKKYLFEARFDNNLKIAVMSSWMHEPHLDEMKLFKINTALNNYKNLNKR